MTHPLPWSKRKRHKRGGVPLDAPQIVHLHDGLVYDRGLLVAHAAGSKVFVCSADLFPLTVRVKTPTV